MGHRARRRKTTEEKLTGMEKLSEGKPQGSIKLTQTQRRKQQCLKDMVNKKEDPVFRKERYNRQMTDYQTSINIRTHAHTETDKQHQEVGENRNYTQEDPQEDPKYTTRGNNQNRG